jgi:hypothetical protein
MGFMMSARIFLHVFYVYSQGKAANSALYLRRHPSVCMYELSSRAAQVSHKGNPTDFHLKNTLGQVRSVFQSRTAIGQLLFDPRTRKSQPTSEAINNKYPKPRTILNM